MYLTVHGAGIGAGVGAGVGVGIGVGAGAGIGGCSRPERSSLIIIIHLHSRCITK